MATNPYELLKQKAIIKILIGDTTCGQIDCDDGSEDCWGVPKSVNISLPDLTGSGICDLSTRFGFPMSYEGNQYTRREYFEKMLEHFIQANRCSELLTFLFGKPQFKEKLSDFPPEKIDEYYDTIVKTILGKINSILHFSGHEMKIIGQKFVVRPSGTKLEVHAPMIERTIDRPYNAYNAARAIKNIACGKFIQSNQKRIRRRVKACNRPKGETPPRNA